MTENTLKLQKEIKRHNVLYYQKNKPEITDREYDELVKKAGIKVVGASPDERFSEIQHVVPMLSLANAYNKKEDTVSPVNKKIIKIESKLPSCIVKSKSASNCVAV